MLSKFVGLLPDKAVFGNGHLSLFEGENPIKIESRCEIVPQGRSLAMKTKLARLEQLNIS